MRSYCIDELADSDIETVTTLLSDMGMASSIEGMFWCPIPVAMLTAEQRKHLPECGPYSMAVIIENNMLILEMLVRARGKIHCTCMGYAPPATRNHMVTYFENLLHENGISG